MTDHTAGKSKLFAAVHQYVVVAYADGIHPELAPLAIGTAYVAREKLVGAIMDYALTELEAALATMGMHPASKGTDR